MRWFRIKKGREGSQLELFVDCKGRGRVLQIKTSYVGWSLLRRTLVGKGTFYNSIALII